MMNIFLQFNSMLKVGIRRLIVTTENNQTVDSASIYTKLLLPHGHRDNLQHVLILPYFLLVIRTNLS